MKPGAGAFKLLGKLWGNSVQLAPPHLELGVRRCVNNVRHLAQVLFRVGRKWEWGRKKGVSLCSTTEVVESLVLPQKTRVVKALGACGHKLA